MSQSFLNIRLVQDLDFSKTSFSRKLGMFEYTEHRKLWTRMLEKVINNQVSYHKMGANF